MINAKLPGAQPAGHAWEAVVVPRHHHCPPRCVCGHLEFGQVEALGEAFPAPLQTELWSLQWEVPELM